MSYKTITTLVLSLALIFAAAPLAGAAKGEGGPIAKIIKHATELSLTTDQISKLEALQKEAKSSKGKEAHKELKEKVKAILTADQLAKIKKYMEENKKAK
jgi:Spy/CpxP family protein refolding chaperone